MTMKCLRMAIIGMFYQDGLTGSAWGDWALYTDSPLRAFENETGSEQWVLSHEQSMLMDVSCNCEGCSTLLAKTGRRPASRGLLGPPWALAERCPGRS